MKYTCGESECDLCDYWERLINRRAELLDVAARLMQGDWACPTGNTPVEIIVSEAQRLIAAVDAAMEEAK